MVTNTAGKYCSGRKAERAEISPEPGFCPTGFISL